ncbi:MULTISPECIES: preprotein translocase subunit SecE [unclassified Dietzia]|uniref:preprotein translocase subunit SecE n=1 Tax=unclassified Dietzia TaxID=2617939 RepID=UPI000D21F1D5|nr:MULTISPECIES: preprotein translocase subunit SecE [unclassified Dietzia]AVZ40127.1 preprotein translocase subunit SecE [Dietzia sp. JS16-p6b]QGW25558.1 preprotein translocase subunit SecE [Dietzia sp. DQ12-45-1b]
MSQDRDDDTSGARGSDGAAGPTGAPVPTGKAGRGDTTVASRVRTDADTAEDTRNNRANPFQYIGQVVEELRKVIWPTRNQMVTYTIVVFLFLIFMTALVSGVDFGAGKLVELVFDR